MINNKKNINQDEIQVTYQAHDHTGEVFFSICVNGHMAQNMAPRISRLNLLTIVNTHVFSGQNVNYLY